jgi:hypothetical protein
MSNAADTLITLGDDARRRGSSQDAKQLFDKAVEFCRAAADPALLASSLTGLAARG